MDQEWNIIELNGDLRARHLDAVKSHLLQHVNSSVELHLGQVSEADTATIQLFLSLRKELSSQDHALRLSHVPENIHQMLALYGLTDLVHTAEV